MHTDWLTMISVIIFALLLWQMMRTLSPSRRELEAANEKLQQEIKEKEQALQNWHRTKAMLDSFMSYAPTITFVKNSDGTYAYVNNSINDILHVEPQSIIGKRDSDWLPETVVKSIQARELHAIEKNQPVYHVQDLPGPEGKPKRILMINFPLVGIDEKLLGGIGIDVTESEEAHAKNRALNIELQARIAELEMLNEHLQSARDQALEASRLKSQFVANISHEVRTPMSGVLGMAELLVDRDDLNPDAHDIAEHIYTSAQSLLSVVNDLLDFSKLEAGRINLEIEPFSLKDVIDGSMQSIKPVALKKNLDFNYTLAADIPELVQGDPGRIRQILLNLLHNAIKFTPSGNVTLDAKVEDETDDTVTVQFVVSDTGIGIDKDVQEKLFEPFVQADGSSTRTYGGTGLGLSISKNLVQLMDGIIGFDSEKGKGSKFWFKVPFQKSPQAAPAVGLGRKAS